MYNTRIIAIPYLRIVYQIENRERPCQERRRVQTT